MYRKNVNKSGDTMAGIVRSKKVETVVGLHRATRRKLDFLSLKFEVRRSVIIGMAVEKFIAEFEDLITSSDYKSIDKLEDELDDFREKTNRIARGLS